MKLESSSIKKADIQMSEAFVTSVFLALSGGFQDAYTYFTRQEVFSNAQTGNIVLMSTHLMMALSVSTSGICRRRVFCGADSYAV